MNPAASLADTPETVPFKQDATVIGLVGMVHASSHFGHLLLPTLFPVFVVEFGFSYAQLGLLMTVFFVISGMGQASSGFLVDRLGARPLLFLALALFASACLLASVVSSYVGLLCVASLAGLANSTFHPVDFTILNQKVSAARLGYAFSAHGLTGNLGWALAPVFFAGFGFWFSWRGAYVAAAMLYLVVMFVVYLHRGKLQTLALVRRADVPQEHSMAFMKLPVVWWCFSFFMCSTMTLAVVQNFSVPILKAMHNISYEAATVTLTAYMLCGAAGMFAGGFVAARAGKVEQVVASTMATGAMLLVLCATGWLGPVLTMVVLASTGFAIGIGAPSRDLMIRKATPKGATGRVYGLVYSGFDTGFALAPLIFGTLMDHQHHALTLLGAAVVLSVSVFIALGVGQRTVQPTSALSA